MFYDEKLMRNRRIGNLWKLAHNLEIRDDKEIKSLRKTCKRLKKLFRPFDEQHSQLSLRTSSTLVAGAARSYKRKLDELFSDVLVAVGGGDTKLRRKSHQAELSKTTTESDLTRSRQENSAFTPDPGISGFDESELKTPRSNTPSNSWDPRSHRETSIDDKIVEKTCYDNNQVLKTTQRVHKSIQTSPENWVSESQNNLQSMAQDHEFLGNIIPDSHNDHDNTNPHNGNTDPFTGNTDFSTGNTNPRNSFDSLFNNYSNQNNTVERGFEGFPYSCTLIYENAFSVEPKKIMLCTVNRDIFKCAF